LPAGAWAAAGIASSAAATGNNICRIMVFFIGPSPIVLREVYPFRAQVYDASDMSFLIFCTGICGG
jgi:hypothetical protein